MPFCKNCGAQIPDVAKFCSKCGTAITLPPVQKEQQVAETVQPPAPPIQPLQQPAQPVKPVQPVQQPAQQPVQNMQQPAQPVQQPQQPVQTQQPQQPKPPKKPADFTWFNNHFMVMFVIFGAIALALNELAGAYLSMNTDMEASTGFGITLAVLAIIFAAGFCAVGIVRFIASFKESKEDRKKHSTRDIICLALGIIAFVFVLMSAIVVFKTASDLNDLEEMINDLMNAFMGMY